MSGNSVQFSTALALAQRVTQQFAQLPQVEAVALGGSQSASTADSASDVDLYVYCREPIGLDVRGRIAADARRAEIGNEFWEPGDEWIDGETGISVDVMFRDVRWIEERLNAILKRHQASVGYSTCFWYNVRNSRVLFDRAGWFARLQDEAAQPYPAELKRAVIAKNFPVLRGNLSSYRHQIELAITRKDWVSVQHRTTALLASYFEVLFAVNEQPHPGEKRLVERASALCGKLPEGFPRGVEDLLAALSGHGRQIVEKADALVEGLESLLRRERLLASGEKNDHRG